MNNHFCSFLQSFYFSLGETSIEPSYDCVRGIIKDFGFEIMVREMFNTPISYSIYKYSPFKHPYSVK